MTKLILTRGLPGSGKTTWAVEQPEMKAPSRDDLRQVFAPGSQGNLSAWLEAAVTKAQTGAVTELLKAGYDVIVDDTNLNSKTSGSFADLAWDLDCDFQIVDFDASPDVCISRNAKRAAEGGRNVPIKAIQAMAKRYPYPWPEIKARRPHISGANPYSPHKPDCVIFDIDGTLAHGVNRNIFDESRVSTDEADRDIIKILRIITLSYTDIVIVSGRTDGCRKDTLQWLEEHGVVPDVLFMRAKEDHRDDTIVKHEIYEKHISNEWNVIAVFDDRNKVVGMWRKLGLKTLQVQEGNF